MFVSNCIEIIQNIAYDKIIVTPKILFIFQPHKPIAKISKISIKNSIPTLQIRPLLKKKINSLFYFSYFLIIKFNFFFLVVIKDTKLKIHFKLFNNNKIHLNNILKVIKTIKTQLYKS